MDAIETRYLGATDHRGSRIKAATLGNFKASVTVSYDSALNTFANHQAAARALLQKLGWRDVSFVGGSTRTGYVWAADFGGGDVARIAE